MKKCKKCGEEKDYTQFHKDKYSKDGYTSKCAQCRNKNSIEWAKNNREYCREKALEYFHDNSEERLDYRKKYYEKNIEKEKERWKKYREENGDELKEKSKIYRKNNREKINKNERERRKRDIEYKTRKNFSRKIRSLLLGGSKKGSILQYLPYTMQQLKQHFEKQFEPWMNWNNYGKYEEGKQKWNIDHIIPQSKFPYDSMEHENFQKCWALDNLRPLEIIENCIKNNK